MKMDEILNGIQEKLGEENASLISDDFASIMTLTQEKEQELTNRQNQIDKLKTTNEMLVKANGNLLQKVASQTIEEPESREPEKKEPLDYRTLFDKNGKFI